MVLHYIDEHDDQPPQQFVDVVQWCPDIGSSAYLDAIRTICTDDARPHERAGQGLG